MTGRSSLASPRADELIDAVARFIETVAAPQLSGHAAFHARVAVNALRIVERELRLAPQADARAADRLADLLCRHGSVDTLNRELCARIQAGEIDLATPGLLEHLKASVMDRLAIEQPGYGSYRLAMTFEDHA